MPAILPFAARPMRLAGATLALAIAGSLTLAAQAAPPHHGGGSPMTMFASGRHLDQLLDTINASTEQRTQIRAIADAAAADLKAQRQSSQTLHEQAMTLFTQPVVDARAAEALRVQMLAQHDSASKRMLQAALDVSRVLTPEQRQQLGQKMAERRAAMERHQAERAPK